MGKIRVATLGGGEEKEQKRRADARRQTKKSKKERVEGVGMKGGELASLHASRSGRVAVIEGTEIKPEYKKLVEEVESGETLEEGKRKTAKRKRVRERSKRYKQAAGLVDKTKLYPLNEAVVLVKKTSLTRFDGTVELHVNLNPASIGDKGDFRGSVSLPHGTGKEVRVAIADDALIASVEAGKIDFDVLVSHPSMMSKLAKVAKTLGPKGLMPNPKNGTISENPEKRARELSHGQVNFKSEPGNPIVHMPVGKISFEDEKLTANVTAIFAAIGPSKILRTTLSSTMGPGVKVALT